LLLIDKEWNKYKAYRDFEIYTSDRIYILRELKALFSSLYIP